MRKDTFMQRKLLLGCLAAVLGAIFMYLPTALVFSFINRGNFEVVVCTLILSYPVGATVGLLILNRCFLKTDYTGLFSASSSLLGGVAVGLLSMYILLHLDASVLILAPIITGVASSCFFSIAVLIRDYNRERK